METKLKEGDQIIYSPAGDSTGRQPWDLQFVGKDYFSITRFIKGRLRRRIIDIRLLKNYTRYVPRTPKTK